MSTTPILGVLLLEPAPHRDGRGFFVRTLDAAVLERVGVVASSFVQENQSRSRRGCVRGLHLRSGPGEGKLVRCSHGAIFDVLVDVRPGSPTFGRWVSYVLDDVQHRQVYLPPGIAHGFQALTDVADVCYHHDTFYEPGADVAIAWDDPDLAVAWPLPATDLSERDRAAPQLRDRADDLRRWFPAQHDDEVGS